MIEKIMSLIVDGSRQVVVEDIETRKPEIYVSLEDVVEIFSAIIKK